MGASYLKVWFEDKKCTYMCSHPNPTPAHAATITSTETRVPSASILFDLHGSSIPSTFNARDFSWIEMGMFVPLSSLTDLVSDGYDSSSIASMAAGLAVRLKKEISRNEVIEDVLKQRLGEEFTVTHKPVTKRMGKSFSPYSKSKHDA